MKLSALLEDIIPVTQDRDICGICTRAQDVRPGEMFVAITGHAADGHDYMALALERGAAVVLARHNPQGLDRVMRVPDTRRLTGILAARFYDHPSRDLVLVGVTGTNGKTTVTYLLESIFTAAGYVCGVIGTISIRYPGVVRDNPETTPDGLSLQKTLAAMKHAGVTHVIMEVSSHGLDQFRVEGCEFAAGIFTNLTQDHLDYHGDMDSYFACKKRLFTDFLGYQVTQGFGHAIINRDTPRGQELSRNLTYPHLTVGCTTPSDVRASDIRDTLTGIQGRICLPDSVIPLNSPLTGRFNLENILCAAGAACALNVPAAAIGDGITRCSGVPGRLEKVTAAGNRHIFVDYAHTPDALESILKTLKNRAPRRMITVFGCGGDRDRSKRGIMGKIAGAYSHVTLITSDNPRSEDPLLILADIRTGILATGVPEQSVDVLGHTDGFACVADRRDALRAAVRLSRPGDVILAAGKGHETYQITREGIRHFDDRLELTAACEQILAAPAPIPWSVQDLSLALGQEPDVPDPLHSEPLFATIATDSRTIQPRDVFLALRGERFDGHSFITDLADRGITGFVVETSSVPAPLMERPEIRVFETPDTQAALGLLGRYQRNRSGARVLAITGSNGKTTTCRMAARVFSTTYDTLTTAGNLNNEIGVPATLLRMSDRHQWAVVEMGMNHPGEMARLSGMACPDMALITNTAAAHLEGLQTCDNVARAKAEIFEHIRHPGIALIFRDDPRWRILADLAGRNPNITEIVFFGIRETANFMARDISAADGKLRFTTDIDDQPVRFTLNTPARFLIPNALGVIAAARKAGIAVADIQEGLAAFSPEPGRMHIRTLAGDVHLIDDTYNANPGSVTEALKTLGARTPAPPRFAILGDMLELGDSSDAAHQEIGRLAASCGITRLFLCGPQATVHIRKGALDQGMPHEAIFCGSREDIARSARSLATPGTWVLVKGSRGMAMETIIRHWEAGS